MLIWAVAQRGKRHEQVSDADGGRAAIEYDNPRCKVYCFTFATYGGSFCDGGRVSTGVDGGALNGAVRAWVHTNNNCMSGTSLGYGILSRVPGLGKASLMSDDFEAKTYGNYTTSLGYALPKKLENDQPWSLWIGMDGVSFFEGNSGVLIRAGQCQSPAVGHGRKSTFDAVKEIIAARRAAMTSSK